MWDKTGKKVLGHNPYQSIGHLSESRLGPSDSHIDNNTESWLTKEVPNQQCLVIVQEKMDGSNVAVIRQGDELIAVGRSGYRCSDSPMEQHRMFHDFVVKNEAAFLAMLGNNERIVGEWLALAHGTIYTDVKNPFVPFDIFTTGYNRLPFIQFIKRTSAWFDCPTILHMGGACSISRAERLAKRFIKNQEYEGFVYRLEEQGEFKSIAKYVRHGKVDGFYLRNENQPDQKEIWNWRPQ